MSVKLVPPPLFPSSIINTRAGVVDSYRLIAPLTPRIHQELDKATFEAYQKDLLWKYGIQDGKPEENRV